MGTKKTPASFTLPGLNFYSLTLITDPYGSTDGKNLRRQKNVWDR